MQNFNFDLVRKTQFVRKYNYGKGVVDLGEYVVSYATSCSLGCQYCYLNFVKIPSKPVVYTNKEILFQELEELFSTPLYKKYYLNCGECVDSLLTEEHVKLVEDLVAFLLPMCQKYNKSIVVELRTKTDNVRKLLDFGSSNVKVVYATSLIPENIRKNVESNLVTNVEKRIELLNIAIDKGMLVGLRFEPIIIIDFEYVDIETIVKKLISEYDDLIAKIKEKIYSKIDKIHSISLSTIRFTKEQFRFFIDKKSKLVWPEMIVCPDGKYRYSRPIRIEIYKSVIELLKKYFGANIVDKIYLATEFGYIWRACELKIKKMTDVN